jgi:hypothetical protein
MIEVDLKTPTLLLIQYDPEPVVILRNSELHVKQALIPPGKVVPLNIDKCIIIA